MTPQRPSRGHLDSFAGRWVVHQLRERAQEGDPSALVLLAKRRQALARQRTAENNARSQRRRARKHEKGAEATGRPSGRHAPGANVGPLAGGREAGSDKGPLLGANK